VTVAPGHSRVVHLTIDPSGPNHPLGWFAQASHRWRVAAGTYTVYVGGSERDTPLSGTFQVG
jgi:beta-glucosidase